MSDNYDDFNYDPSMYTGYNQGQPVAPTSQPEPYNTVVTSNKEKPEKKKGGFGKSMAKVTALALTFGLVAGGAFQGVNYFSGKYINSTRAEADEDEPATNISDNVDIQPAVSTDGAAGTVSYDVAEIVKKAETSIVSITTKVTTDYTYFFQSGTEEATGAGSGIVIGKSDKVLYIATNYHVVKGADEINVGFCDGELVKADIMGYDEDQDVAVVAVKFGDMKESTTSQVTIAQIGNSDELQVGEPAIAIGNALGYGQSVTVGYISALDRAIEGSGGKYIQTDAAINPGNSGGALINAQGQVIGINSVKYVDSKVEGMGFSIPINTAMDIINGIIKGEIKQQLYLGVNGVEVSKEYSEIYGLPEGIYVKDVIKDSPAEAAGMYAGDIIVEIEGKEVYTRDDVKDRLKSFNEGDTVQIKVYRSEMGKYNEVTLDVTLEAE